MRRLAQAIAVQAFAILLAIFACMWGAWPEIVFAFKAITDALGVTTAVKAADSSTAASTSVQIIETKECEGFYWTTCRTILREEEIAADVVQPEDVVEEFASILYGIIALALATGLGCLLLYLVVRHRRKAAEPVPMPAIPCAEEKTALELLADGVQERLNAKSTGAAALRVQCGEATRRLMDAFAAIDAAVRAALLQGACSAEKARRRGGPPGYALLCALQRRSAEAIANAQMRGELGCLVDGLLRALARRAGDVAHGVWLAAHITIAARLRDPTAAAAVVDLFCRHVRTAVEALQLTPPELLQALARDVADARGAADRLAAAKFYTECDSPARFAHEAFTAAVLGHPLRGGGGGGSGCLDRAAVWFEDLAVGRMRIADGNMAWLDGLAAQAMPTPPAAASAIAATAAPAAAAAATAHGQRPSAVLQLRVDTKTGGGSGSGSSAAPLARHSLMSPLGSSAASLMRHSPTSPRRRNRVTEPRRGG